MPIMIYIYQIFVCMYNYINNINLLYKRLLRLLKSLYLPLLTLMIGIGSSPEQIGNILITRGS